MSDFSKLDGYDVKDAYARSEIAQMKINFQGGVDTIYNAIVAQGITPSSSTPSDCATAITQIGTTQYNSGRSQGRKDVGANASVTNPANNTNPSVTKGKYYIVFVSYSSSGDYRECNLSGCTVIASQRIDITYKTVTYFSTKVFFIKATGSSINVSINVSYSSLNVYLIELGNYE